MNQLQMGFDFWLGKVLAELAVAGVVLLLLAIGTTIYYFVIVVKAKTNKRKAFIKKKGE